MFSLRSNLLTAAAARPRLVCRTALASRPLRTYSSTKDIQDQQHSGSRSAPRPTAETGTSTQAPHDAAASTPPGGEALPDSQQQKAPEQEDGEAGSGNYMAHNEDKQNGELKSNTPFRAAPLEKSVGARTIAPDLEANERSGKK